ncbi:MAG: tetratricopeptide repeat protein [Bacteroidales bacterium]|nr:tetratricopeptide repeat protein [Bacteroidales bacterium]MCB8998571.1 tetratricopeptide repeat protein [Bacteroidales bacterium]MCB9012561.1 tetratricopeptide repeat protein [Bacteroidales bacterium]
MKNKTIRLTLLLSLLSIGLFGQSAKQFFKAGEDFLKNGKYEDAIEQYTKAIQIEPDYDKAYTQRAYVYSQLSKYKEAAEDYDRAIVFMPKDEEVYFNSATMHFKLGEDAIALDKLNKSLDLKSSYIEAIQLKVLVLIDMKRYSEALADAKTALRYKETAENYYVYGLVNDTLGKWADAGDAYQKALDKNDKYLDAAIQLADLQRREKKYNLAISYINRAIRQDPKSVKAYLVRSEIYADQLQYQSAINDISTIILLQPEDANMYFKRAEYYQGFTQHSNAILDFSKVISLQPENAKAYYKRAYSYEQTLQFKNAIKDYETLSKLSKYDANAQELLADAKARLFELNRETNKPVVSVAEPMEKENKVLDVPKGVNVLPMKGIVKDESNLKSVVVNNYTIPFAAKDDHYEFLTSVNLNNSDQLIVEVTDAYDNTETSVYTIRRTEVTPPDIRIIAPYASDNNLIYLDSNDPAIYVEGSILDESHISSINIDGVLASYIPNDLNPTFQATINIMNKSSFTVTAVDEFGNKSEQTFTLNRDAADIAANNPMGKTWVVFIDNSDYENFASLEGPGKDITMMKTALSKYSIHNFIQKKNMSKQEMEKFFAIELRDLLRSNRVNSLLIWYAGHGKYVNETGYWVPVDAKRDDEFTYFNINALKASMQSYPKEVTHTLVITDACESGPSFYQAMRGAPEIKSCDDWAATRLKSSQVFSSAGYELAVDNSQFTKTFANVLANNPNACIPIESIVQKVTNAVTKGNAQKPQFGKIAGLEDENGTFFFMSK